MRLLTTRETAKMLGVSRSTLYELRKRTDFPRPYKIAGIRWRDTSIERWIKLQSADKKHD